MTTPETVFSLVRDLYPEDTIGQQLAATVHQHLSTLTIQIESPQLGGAYGDMARYPAFVLRMIDQLSPTNAADFLLNACGLIRRGVEERSCGIQSAIEDLPDKFATVQGGLQRAILAAEYFPTVLYQHLFNDEEKLAIWQGFLIADHNIPYHYKQVISLPLTFLLNPRTWWTLYHETAHSIIDGPLGFLNEESVGIKRFLRDKRNTVYWKKRLEEFMAELLGYEIGFFSNFEAYNKLIWPFVARSSPFLKEHIDLEEFTTRLFFVKLYNESYGHSPCRPWPSEGDIFDQFVIFVDEAAIYCQPWDPSWAELLSHNKYFLAANAVPSCLELEHIARHFSEIVEVEGLRLSRHRMAELADTDTQQVVRTIMEGRSFEGIIKFPEAVFWHLIHVDTDFSWSQVIAIIQTFSRCKLELQEELSKVRPAEVVDDVLASLGKP